MVCLFELKHNRISKCQSGKIPDLKSLCIRGVVRLGKESVFNGNKPRILWLDFVRSLAILMVVVVHATDSRY